MDTYTEPVTHRRRHRALEEKRRIVEETLAEGASVALVARTHEVNANLVFNWRKLYQAGRLGSGGAKLLPVQVSPELILREHACGPDCLCWNLRRVPAIEEASGNLLFRNSSRSARRSRNSRP